MEGQWLVYYSAVYNLCSPLIQYKKSWFVRDLITIKSVSLFKDKANIIYNIYCIGALSLQVKAGGPSLPLPKGYKLGGPSCAVIEYSCLVRVPWALVYFRFIFTVWIVLWVAWIPHDPGGHRFGRPSGESGVQGDEFLLVKSVRNKMNNKCECFIWCRLGISANSFLFDYFTIKHFFLNCIVYYILQVGISDTLFPSIWAIYTLYILSDIFYYLVLFLSLVKAPPLEPIPNLEPLPLPLWSRPWPDTLGLFPQTQGGVHGRPRRCCVQSSAWVGLCSTRACKHPHKNQTSHLLKQHWWY